MQAAMEAARELLGPIVAMTITLAAVYAPIGFQGGMTGALFLEFAITLAAAVLVSGFVAVTLSPVMSALRGARARQGSVADAPGRPRLRVACAPLRTLLDGALAIRWAIVVAALLVTLAPGRSTPARAELAPVEDQSHISMFFDAAPDATLEASTRDSREGRRSRAESAGDASSCGRWSPTGAGSAAW
jgi:multidrug efflux pump